MSKGNKPAPAAAPVLRLPANRTIVSSSVATLSASLSRTASFAPNTMPCPKDLTARSAVAIQNALVVKNTVASYLTASARSWAMSGV